MLYILKKRDDIKTIPRGKVSPLSTLLAQLKNMQKDEAVLIETSGMIAQRKIYQRMRSNVSKWKKTKGLKGISVHLVDGGSVALYYEKHK